MTCTSLMSCRISPSIVWVAISTSQENGSLEWRLLCPSLPNPELPGWPSYWALNAATVEPNVQFGRHGPLTRYAQLRVAHAPGMPRTFPPTADFKGNCYVAISACNTARASRTCRDACRDHLPAVTGKTFPAFPAHAHPQLYVSGKRPMEEATFNIRVVLTSWLGEDYALLALKFRSQRAW